MKKYQIYEVVSHKLFEEDTSSGYERSSIKGYYLKQVDVNYTYFDSEEEALNYIQEHKNEYRDMDLTILPVIYISYFD